MKNRIKINKIQIKEIQKSLLKVNNKFIERKYKQKALLNDCPICTNIKVRSEIKKKHMIFVFCKFIEIELFDKFYQPTNKMWVDISHSQILNTKNGEQIIPKQTDITKMFRDKDRHITIKKHIKIIKGEK
jgi:hypothetical protein